MVTRRRILAIVVLALLALLVVLWLVVHSRGVQRAVTERVIAAINDSTGWQLEVDDARLRVWPARLLVEGLTVSSADQRVASVARIEATWSWPAVLGTPRRIESVELAGVDVDLRGVEPPDVESSAAETASDPWRVVEIGRLVLTRGRVDAAALDVDGTMEGIRIEGSMVDGRAQAGLDADRLVLVRQGRSLDLGSVALDAEASANGIVVQRLAADGPEIGVDASAEVELGDPPSGRGRFTGRADLTAALGWWDPNLVTGLEVDGVLDLDGRVAFDASNGLTAEVVHRGDPVTVAGYELDVLELGLDDGVPTVRLAGPEWGSATITPHDDATARVEADLDDAPVGAALALIAPTVADALGRPVRLSGTVDGTVGFPVTLDTLSGTVDVTVRTRDGVLALAGGGTGQSWSLDRFRVDTEWARVDGNGELGPGGRVSADLELEVTDVARARQVAGAWLELPDELTIGGGPISGDATLSGTIGQPSFTAHLEWQHPAIFGYGLDRVSAAATGSRAGGEWSVEVEASPSASAAAAGTIDLDGPHVAGTWRLALDDLGDVPELARLGADAAPDIGGRLSGDGSVAWAPDGWRVAGHVNGRRVVVDEWALDELDVDFDVDPESAVVRSLSASLLGGEVGGTAEVGLSGIDAPLSAAIDWHGLDLEQTPIELPVGAQGVLTGRLSVAGTAVRPTAELDVEWTPNDPGSPAPPISFVGALEDGVVRLVTREVATNAGSGIARVTIPLGAFDRPGWVWPGAPDEPVRVVVDGRDLRSDALLALAGIDFPQATATGELTLDATWHPRDPEQTRVLAELNGLRIEHAVGVIEAKQPLEFTIDGTKITLEPVVLVGPRTRIELAGQADLGAGTVDGRLDAMIAPSVAKLIPYPVQIFKPIQLSAVASGSLKQPRASITISHPDGVLVVRDPPLQIRDLTLSAELVDGVLWIEDGSAEVNQGRVELGGGWDPESGQGIVAEVDNVVVFVEGVLTQWSGTVALEPQPDRLAKITGELNLVAGLWDQDVDLGGMIFGSTSLDPGRSDLLDDVVLDLDVRGRGVVRVENNLGRFDARWDVLRVAGTAAAPRIRGEIKIAPGGRLSLAGQQVNVRRGSLVFTGDPGVDPVVNIVPESNIAAFGGTGDAIDTTSLATQGLVGGLAGALGFENETLQPAEISVEVEKDSSEQLMIGQRLSHNIALFFATNTGDVQDRTSMIQLWHLPGLKGLAIQGYEKTLTEEIGGNAIQRFQWGGTSLYEDRATIRKLKLEGDWPISKRRLKKATGFRRGQPYDSFLTFVAKVRMERELARAGFQEATVDARAEESNNAWTMFFSIDPGPRQEVVFEGADPPRRIREEVTAAYQPPPLEAVGFQNMSSLLDRFYDAEGYPETQITVERRGDAVVAEIDRGSEVELTGPVLPGAPDEVERAVQRRLGSPTELALLPKDQERAKRVVGRVLDNLGYPDAEVRSVTEVRTDQGRAEVRIEADLGARAVVDELVVTGEDPLGLTRADDFGLSEGRPIDRTTVDLVASQMRASYDAAGYSDARVSGSMTERDEGGWRVEVHIEPGRRLIVRDIEITGLKYTKEKVLRSGIAAEEGEILRNPDLDTTAVRIANFATVDRVDVQTEPEGTDGAKVVLDVSEKPRWTTEVGGGWSTERGAQARFGLRDDNLFGRGLSLNLRGRWDRTEWLGFVVASWPPRPGKRLSFTSTIGISRGDEPGDTDFNQDERFWSAEVTRWLGGGDLAIGTAGEQITGYYRFTRTRVWPKEPDPFLPPDLLDITRDVGILGARYVHDRFDSPFDPTSGYGVIVDAGWADELISSDLAYWSTLATGSTATGAPFESTWIQTLRLGITEPLRGQDLVRQVKFFAGGQGSIRGFDRDSVGPVIDGRDDWDPNGGGALFILNEEIRIPIKGGFRAALFADVGQVWESWGEADWGLAVGAGIGIRWATPIGPVWADVAWPVVNPWVIDPSVGVPPGFPDNRRMSSSKPKFYFGIGRPF